MSEGNGSTPEVTIEPTAAGSGLRGPARSRRQVLASLGAITAAGAAGIGLPILRAGSSGLPGSAEQHAASAEGVAKHQWVMVFDLRLCDGCGECTTACNEMHHLPEDQPWIPVSTMRNAGGQEYFVPRPCMQCEDPPCTKACPVTATYRVADGVTLIDQEKCIGCRMCLAACPYQHRTFNWDPPPAVASLTGPTPEFPVPQRLGTAGKCVMCVHNLRVGKLPACAEKCGMNAVFIGDLETDTMTNGADTYRLSQYLKENDAFRLREELNTRPRVYYVAGHGQNLEF